MLKRVEDNGFRIGSSVYTTTLSWFDEMHSFLGKLFECPEATECSEPTECRETTECHETLNTEIKLEPTIVGYGSGIIPKQELTTDHSTIDDILKSAIQCELPTNAIFENSSNSASMSRSPSTSSERSNRQENDRRKRLSDNNSILSALKHLENISHVVNAPQQQTHTIDEFYFLHKA